MGPALNRSSELQLFEHSDVIDNTRRNNVCFLPATATYISIFIMHGQLNVRREKYAPFKLRFIAVIGYVSSHITDLLLASV